MTAGKNRSAPLPTNEQRYRELKQQLQDVGFVCVGSLQTRYLPFVNASCRCHQDPAKRHGPYHYWTRKVKGRTVSVLVKQEQVPLYREWIQNNARRDKRRDMALVRGLAVFSGVPFESALSAAV